jgi:hypothetical protein
MTNHHAFCDLNLTRTEEPRRCSARQRLVKAATRDRYRPPVRIQ